MKNFKFSAIVLFLISGSLLISCNDPSVIGLSVQPASDKFNVQYTDTITLNSYTISTDSVKTDNSSVNMLGSYVDPIFGKSSSSIFAQLDLLTFNNIVGANPIADSIVLSLAYTGYYGDTTTTQSLNVYQLTENIYSDSIYYSNRSFGYSGLSIGSLVYNPTPNTYVTVNGVLETPQLRVKMDNQIANNILNANPTILSSNAAFSAFFKGIYIKTNDVSISGKGAILYFNALSSYSGITIYYHNATASGLLFNLVFDNSAARVNHFEHDYSGTLVAQQLATPSLGLNTLYSQCMSGVKTYIDFPYLKHLVDFGKIAINKAELIVTATDASNALYPLPANMILYGLDSVGNEISLPDYSLSTFQVPLTNSNEYHFVINDYVQRILNDSASSYQRHITNHGLHLVCALGAASANRVIIGGPKNPTIPMKLKITYTKL